MELYKNGSPDLVEILLGSSSLDEILDGIETANRVSEQDTQILREVQQVPEGDQAARGRARRRRAQQPGAGRRRARGAQAGRDRGRARAAPAAPLAPSRTRSPSCRPPSAGAQARLEAAARARVASDSPHAAATVADRRAVLAVRRRRRDRHAVPGHPVPVGRLLAEHRLRLLGLLDVRLLAGRRLAPAHRLDAVRRRRRRLALGAPARRPRLLQRPRPRGHLHRRRTSSSTRRTRATSSRSRR